MFNGVNVLKDYHLCSLDKAEDAPASTLGRRGLSAVHELRSTEENSDEWQRRRTDGERPRPSAQEFSFISSSSIATTSCASVGTSLWQRRQLTSPVSSALCQLAIILLNLNSEVIYHSWTLKSARHFRRWRKKKK